MTSTVQPPRSIRRGPVDFYLVATARDGSGLYEDRNWRMGGREYRIRLPDGTQRNGQDYGALGRVKPKPPPAGGRWAWLKED